MTQPALRFVPDPMADLTGHQRLAASIRPEFQVNVYWPSPDDDVLYRACKVEGCLGIRTARYGLCTNHRYRLLILTGGSTIQRKRNAILEDALIEKFLVDPQLNLGPHDGDGAFYSFEGLPQPLANELRYFLQMRKDKYEACVLPRAFNRLKVKLLEANVMSLFDGAECSAYDMVAKGRVPTSTTIINVSGKAEKTMVFAAMEAIAPLYAYLPMAERDCWRMEDFGIRKKGTPSSQNIRFDAYRSSWLKAWVKRFTEYRIKIGKQKWRTHAGVVSNAASFDRFLTAKELVLRGPQDIQRDHLVDYLHWIKTDGEIYNAGKASAIRMILDTDRVLGWTSNLPHSAVILKREVPTPTVPLPEPIDPFVLAQLMDATFLDQVNPILKNAMIISRWHGIRVSSLALMKFDPVTHQSGGPVLNYYNVKLNRPAVQPIMKQVVLDAIRRQQAYVRSKYGDDCEWLFPADSANPLGKRHTSSASITSMFGRAFEKVRLKDKVGRDVHVHWHQFRDTFATELLNRSPNPVPPAVVAALLDHVNTRSLDHYCRVQAETMREQLNEGPRLNIHGEDIRSANTSGREIDLEFWRDNLRLVSSTVAGGYCGLPVHEACPHHNRCFTCEDYVTSPANLPFFLGHLEETQQLRMTHESQGKQREIEKARTTESEVLSLIRVLVRWSILHPGDLSPMGIEGWWLNNKDQLTLLAAEDARQDD